MAPSWCPICKVWHPEARSSSRCRDDRRYRGGKPAGPWGAAFGLGLMAFWLAGSLTQRPGPAVAAVVAVFALTGAVQLARRFGLMVRAEEWVRHRAPWLRGPAGRALVAAGLAGALVGGWHFALQTFGLWPRWGSSLGDGVHWALACGVATVVAPWAGGAPTRRWAVTLAVPGLVAAVAAVATAIEWLQFGVIDGARGLWACLEYLLGQPWEARAAWARGGVAFGLLLVWPVWRPLPRLSVLLPVALGLGAGLHAFALLSSGDGYFFLLGALLADVAPPALAVVAVSLAAALIAPPEPVPLAAGLADRLMGDADAPALGAAAGDAPEVTS